MILEAWLSWLVPLASSPLVPLASLAGRRAASWVALAATGASMLFALYAALTPVTYATESLRLWFPPMGVSLQVKVDGLSLLVGAFVAFVSFLIVVYSVGYMREEPGQARYYSLVLLFIGSMMGLVMSGNLIQFYFFWELVGVCSALLIGFWSDRPEARRAGLKAFAVTRLGDAALLLGVIAVASTFGTTAFDSVLGPSGVATLGGGAAFALGLLFILGAMGKSAQVPLHVWLPDAMEGPTTVSALIHAATMVNAGVFLLLRMFPLFVLPQLSGSLTGVILAVGLTSTLVGGVCAFAADDLKRVLAYSTISQLGLMFAAIGLGSLGAAAYQMISQGLFKALAFLAAGSVIAALGTRDMGKMGGLARAMKFTYVGFLASVLAMSGVPPLVGFWSKDAIYALAVPAGALPTVLMLLAFSITALYSFRALIRVFHGAMPAGAHPAEPPGSMLLPIGVLTLAVAGGWTVLQSQALLPFSSGLPEVDTLAATLTVLGLSVIAAYLVSLRFHSRAVELVASSSVLGALRGFALGGLGFDRLYSALLERLLPPLSRAATKLQTGLVRVNTSMVLLAVVALFLLFASGVL